MGFPKSICTSVNEVVCHGIPDARPLEDGDIVNLDVTVCLNGYHGDLNETYLVGTGAGHPEKERRRRKVDGGGVGVPRARHRAVSPRDAIPRSRGGDSDACARGRIRRGEGFLRARHRRALSLRSERAALREKQGSAGTMWPGMTFTIEPMVNEGTHKTKTWPDGWTAVTADGGRSAQYEHTLAITETGVEVLTARTPN